MVTKFDYTKKNVVFWTYTTKFYFPKCKGVQWTLFFRTGVFRFICLLHDVRVCTARVEPCFPFPRVAFFFAACSHLEEGTEHLSVFFFSLRLDLCRHMLSPIRPPGCVRSFHGKKKRQLPITILTHVMQSVSPVDGVVVDTTLSCSKVPASSLETAQLQQYLARNYTHRPAWELGKPSACQCFIGRQSWVTSWCRMRWQPITTCTDQPAPDKERHRVIACVPMVVQGKKKPTSDLVILYDFKRATVHPARTCGGASCTMVYIPYTSHTREFVSDFFLKKKNPYIPHLGAVLAGARPWRVSLQSQMTGLSS